MIEINPTHRYRVTLARPTEIAGVLYRPRAGESLRLKGATIIEVGHEAFQTIEPVTPIVAPPPRPAE